jgi:5-methylthioribose kinase
MRELTPENALAYLRERGWIGPGPAGVEALGWGVSNAVLRVEADDKLFVLKQSRPQLRTRAEWFSDLERVYREQEVMEALAPLLPAGVVPAVLHADRADFVFVMEHAPADSVVWKEALLRGEVDLGRGELAGAILGRLHEATARDPALIERFRDPTVFVQLRVDPFYRRVQQARPEVAAPVERLVERLLSVRSALCHGDYSPKNLLGHAGGFTLVDYETAYGGDPAFDLGFCVSHLLLKAIKRAHDPRHVGLVRSFWRGYAAAARSLDLADMEAAGVGHCGACLLARVDGTSPVDYLTGPGQQETARSLGRRVLLGGLRRWDEVLDAVEGASRG